MKRYPEYPEINRIETARRIKFLMEYRQLKPVDLKEYLGLTCVQTVYRWLDGTNIPTIDNLYALSQLFRIQIDEIVAGNKSEMAGFMMKLSQRRGMDGEASKKTEIQSCGSFQTRCFHLLLRADAYFNSAILTARRTSNA